MHVSAILKHSLQFLHSELYHRKIYLQNRIPTVKLKIPGKLFFKVGFRTSVTFKLQFLTLAIYQWQQLGLSKYATMKKCEKRLFYFSHFFMVAYLLSPNRCHWQIVKVKNYNLNVTEVRYPAFLRLFPGIFNFTVGILTYTNLELYLI